MRIFWVEVLAIFLCVGGGCGCDVGERCVGMWGSSASENAILGWMEAMNYGKEAVDEDLGAVVDKIQ